MEKETARQELRWRNMQHQFYQIQRQVSLINGNEPEGNAHAEDQPDGDGHLDEAVDQMVLLPGKECLAPREPKLLPLTGEDDIEHFLATFERMAHVCHWPKDGWAVRLVPLLTGKARSAYVSMDIQDSEDYDKVKVSILSKYEITPETYRQQFRSLKIEPGETPKELYVRLKELFSKWVKPEKSTVQEISETIILEQFLRMVNPDLEVWIREHDPKTAKEAAQLAEVFT